LVLPDQAILQYHDSDLLIDWQEMNQYAIAEDTGLW
jgi:hypothetical protein